MRALTLALLGLSVAPFVAAAAGCTSPLGDPAADAGGPTPLGSGLRLHQIIPPATGDKVDGFPPNPMHPAQNQLVSVTGESVITVDTFDETMDGKSVGSLYVQDVGSQLPYSGIECYSTLYQPASLKVAPGDVIDLYGQYQDFAGPSTALFPLGQALPEMAKPNATFRFEYTVPTPVVVDPNDFSTADEDHFYMGQRWLGMLVEVKGGTLGTWTADGKGRLSGNIVPNATGVAIDNELFDMKASDYPPGTTFKSIVGVPTFFFSFHIAPRSATDIVVDKLGTPVDAGAHD